MLLIAGQIGVALVIAIVLGAVVDVEQAYSALVGAMIGVVPNYYFAVRLMRRRSSAAAEQTLRNIYVGEFFKVAFASALFVIAIMLLDVNFLVVVLTYVAMVVVNWIAFLVLNLSESAPAGHNVGSSAR